MIGLRQLTAIPDLGLATDNASDREVRSVHLLSDTDWIGRDLESALIISDIAFLGDRERLFGTLAVARAAGVVVTRPVADDALHALSAIAARYRLPLLTSTRTLRQWRTTLAGWVNEMRVAALQQHAARLSALFDQLRSPATDMVQSIADLLSRELGAEVVVVSRGQVLAAAPATASMALSSVLKDPGRRQQTTPAGLFAHVEPLGAAEESFVAVGLKDPHGRSERALASHAANALGLALAPRGGEADYTQALSKIRLAAFQLLMTGHVTDAQRVMASVSPGLLDSQEARVFIIDCAQAPRDAVMAEVERDLRDVTMAVRCPAYPDHIINVVPVHDGPDPEQEISRLLNTFHGAKVSAGGSSPYPLENVGAAYGEALDALGRTEYRTEKMIVNKTKALGLADILPADLATAWASRVLHPALAAPGGQEILNSVAMALEFKTTKAARIIGIHRNTLSRRVMKVFADVGCNPDRTLDRIAISLAMQIVATYGADTSRDYNVSLHDVLSVQPVQAWAEKFLRPLATDNRDLLWTVRAWVLAEFDADAAGTQLQIAGRTVRWRVQQAESLVEKDLITIWPHSEEGDEREQRLGGIRPLTVALYASTPPGAARPALTDPTRLNPILTDPYNLG